MTIWNFFNRKIIYYINKKEKIGTQPTQLKPLQGKYFERAKN
jgi:hypothetical protein